MATGNGPQWTSPLFCSDEDIAIIARGDFWMLCPPWQVIASGSDGSFAANAPWILNSAGVDFQAQGVAAQQVIALTAPQAYFRGGPHLFAVDSASGTSCTLRRMGQPPNVGQPPSPTTGLTSVTFEIRTLGPQIDNSTYKLKRRLAIDEMIYFRSSDWMYQGAEDPYRPCREAVAYGAMMDAYEQETRDSSNAADFARKAKRARERYEEAINQIEVRWGPFGVSGPSTSLFGCRLSR